MNNKLYTGIFFLFILGILIVYIDLYFPSANYISPAAKNMDSNTVISDPLPHYLAAPSIPTINVPIYDIEGGGVGVINPYDLTQNLLDGNNWSLLWSGKVSDGKNNYFDVRFVGNTKDTKDSSGSITRPAGLRIRVQLIDKFPQAGDSFVITINGKTYTTLYSVSGTSDTSPNGEVGNRCGSGGCRGWTIDRLISWTDLGGRPAEGTNWSLSTTFNDSDPNNVTSTVNWTGQIHWGLPNYYGNSTSSDQKLNIPVTADSTVGGNTECGSINDPEYFSSWGKNNFENPIIRLDGSTKDYSPYALAQNQWDISDWPCFSKLIVQWNTPSLPSNTNITKATLTYFHFGEPGYSNTTCYADNKSNDTIFQVYEITSPFVENQITWDTLPQPRENISRLLVPPSEPGCNNNGTRDPAQNPYPRVFDITEIVKRGIAENRTIQGLIIYTSAGQYHSGKYFWAAKNGTPGAIDIYYNSNVVPTAGGCSMKSQGDADCNGIINLVDFEIWRKEYMQTLNTKTADFNTNGIVDLIDFEVWRKSYLK